ncbi:MULTISPECIES: hypothetical protein [unclassified Polaribacter]|uniref:hypothetical protein n=1 Tax=unclassified Polaribacter TaxID=196858 RepID=UPI001C4EDDB8|nr:MULTISPECIES: hypothetical protein [unclassified Polaribacter]QXP63676.1 hypothetical protein H0I27_00310 [Polaribacter sp. HaHaR_3_91]QXP66182.1 hypothetical protein H0I28_13455 [Polaribacter sp. AHE13PA]
MKVKVALFFILIFSSLLITPTVISLIDSTQDISVLINMNEEEENHGKNTLKEVKIIPYSDVSISFRKNQKIKNVRYRSKNYISEYPKIVTPPPKFVL